ncbi:Ig-like domain-containing protein [Streptomyces sp. NPDC059398]|uniref:L,D-transpeptidase n=1 Tax=Streptomyces sp. NPDC059398 TaxID=3346820 RepID=UPI00369FA8A8
MRQLTKRTRAGVAAALAAVCAGLLGGLAGCGAGSDGKPRAPEEAIRVMPDDGAKGVRAHGKVEVRVPDGQRLEQVTVYGVTDGHRQVLPGTVSDDGRTWKPDGGRLGLASQYAVDAVASDGDGHTLARHTTFTTYVPPHRFIGYFTPENGTTVGTGMIVSFNFSRPVQNRAAVERAIRVTATPSVPVAGHWFGAGRLDFRPSAYWKPGTRVSVGLRLRDVQASPGVYGTQQKTIAFTVGRSQVSLVDAAAHTMAVRRDGALLTTLPVTAGARKHTTYNGRMVVMEKRAVTRMNGRTVGFGGEYDIPDVPHAMRLTRSGTFLHGNYWAPARVFGASNTSHGCVGLRDARGGSATSPAGWLFDHTLIGDVVEVVNSRDTKVAPDNGLGGWNLDWAHWRSGSALG